jgi:hypothetical protein
MCPLRAKGSSSSVIGNWLPNENEGNGNTIAFNGNDGVQITEGRQNLILSNSIFKNGNEGIDLSPEGVNPSDSGDPDPGPNELQTSPQINSVTITPNGTDLEGEASIVIGRTGLPCASFC